MKNSFAENIKYLRESKNLTQQQLAENLMTTQRKVSYWENGMSEPDMDTLIQLSKFFDVSIDFLLGVIS